MSENTDYETLKAERDSALNTCTLIAEALGITGAVAGDTIARVQQLVGENAVMLKLLTDISENHSEFVDEGDGYMCASIPLDYVSEINMYVSRDVNAENPFPATDAAINEIKAQGVDEFADNWQGKESHSQISEMARRFAASLRGEQNA
ncbi:TPA: hypothetical protein ACX4EX_001610 [Yersinia enterocolitica]|uniref:hypothetical protein n=1 Tax=Yersinia enterocolitica TaxID=630 RepID=UPI0005FD0648|nr:hypothetical protein [Yersinia enterocolitica]CRE93579.1 Uncharacterised protein [Yersinia enterocolitica]